MENEKPENQFAFACVNDKYLQEGMTLRNYVAAKALPSVIKHSYGKYGDEVIVEHCFKIADEFLKQSTQNKK